MKNMVGYLCIRDDVKTIRELSNLLEIDKDYAYSIVCEQCIIDETTIDKLCLLFNVTREFLLCEDSNNVCS